MVEAQTKPKSMETQVGNATIFIVFYLIVSVVVGLLVGLAFKFFMPTANLTMIRVIAIFLTFVVLYSYFRV